MSKQTTFRLQAVKWVTKGEAPSWAGNSNLWVSLHHTSPVWSDDQTLYEVSYPGYARQPIARNASAWAYNTVTGSASNAAPITFPSPNGGSTQEVWWVGLGTAETGPGQLLYNTNVFEEAFLIVLHEPLIVPVGGLILRET